VLERFPPHACVVEGTEEVGGRTTRVYGFRQGISVPAQPAAAEHDAAEAAESVNRVWIDEADGRPRKVESEFAGLRRSMTIDYEAIKPPVS
jgi:outer membrane lipoprotein-sorting protein